MSNTFDYDVIVVGGGPSGLVAAAEASRYGVSVAVLEKRTGPPLTRAGTVLPRPLELFDARGIAERFVARTCEVNPHPFTTEHIWAGLHPVNWSGLDSRFGFTLYLAQFETESLLRDWVAECGVVTLVGHEVTKVTEHDDHVELAVDREGELVNITAKYVVGADGARGATRKSLGIPMEGFDGTFTGVAAILNMPFPWSEGYVSVTNEHGWLLSFPFGPNLTRMGIVHTEGMGKDRDEPVTLEEIAKYASDIMGEKVDIPSLAEANRYSNARKMAASFGTDRVFLVGEALRFHYPASGVGMNFCIQDAFNLGWKVGAVAAGKAEPELLRSYEAERRPVCLNLLDSVDAQVGVQFDFSREGQQFLKRFQSRLITQPDVAAQLRDELQGMEVAYPRPETAHESVGWPMPDLEIMLRDGSTTRVYEALRGNDFVLVDMSNSTVVDVEAAESAGVTVLKGHPVRKPAGLADAAVVLVRPDAYVGWAATIAVTTEEITAAVQSRYSI